MTVDSSIPDITIIFYFHLREEKNFFTIRKAIKQIIADPMEIKKIMKKCINHGQPFYFYYST